MTADKNLDWLTLCPEQFREKLASRLRHHPEIPKSTVFEQDKQEAQTWGKYAEALTARYLVTKGMPLREMNWKPQKGRGEIDIITQRGNRIIFVEVKARSGERSDPWESITQSKINDLCHGADIYLKMQRERYEYQFDVALYWGSYDNFEFEYLEDAFLCPLKTPSHKK